MLPAPEAAAAAGDARARSPRPPPGWSRPFALLLAVGAWLRLRDSGGLPVFIDEAIHTALARRAAEGDWRAGMDIFRWLAIQFFGLGARFGLDDPERLRLLSALCGVVNIALAGGIARALGGPRAGWMAAGVHALLPFAVFFERQVLVDVPLSTAFLALCWLSLLTLRTDARWPAAGLALVLPLVTPLKASGILFVLAPLVALGLPPEKTRRLGRPRRLLAALAIGGAPAAWLAVRVFPDGGELARVAVTSSDGGWLSVVGANLRDAVVLFAALGGALLPAALAGACLPVRAKGPARARLPRRVTAGLVAWLLLAWAPWLLLSAHWFPRYLLPGAGVASALAGLSLSRRWFPEDERAPGPRARWTQGALAALALLSFGWSLRAGTLTGVPVGWIPERIRFEYLTGPFSGIGLPELVGELGRRAAESPGTPLRVHRPDSWDHPRFSLDTLADGLPANVELNLFPAAEPERVLDGIAAAPARALLVLNAGPGYRDDTALLARVEADPRFRVVWRGPAKPGGRPSLALWSAEAPSPP